MTEPSKPIYFSIVVPAHNEEDCIERTCTMIVKEFASHSISDYEIVLVNDNSQDRTEELLHELARRYSTVRYVNNLPPNGFGLAVCKGLEVYRGQVVCVVMADLSDSPKDIVMYYQKSLEGWECIFGSRFIRGSKVTDYPKGKLVLNRFVNRFIQFLFWINLNDITNPFKCYRRNVIAGVQPIVSHHFNLELELPLKAIIRGYRWTIVPISWTNRDAGRSKFHIRKLAGRTLFILISILAERWLSGGDYFRRDKMS